MNENEKLGQDWIFPLENWKLTIEKHIIILIPVSPLHQYLDKLK